MNNIEEEQDSMTQMGIMIGAIGGGGTCQLFHFNSHHVVLLLVVIVIVVVVLVRRRKKDDEYVPQPTSSSYASSSSPYTPVLTLTIHTPNYENSGRIIVHKTGYYSSDVTLFHSKHKDESFRRWGTTSTCNRTYK